MQVGDSKATELVSWTDILRASSPPTSGSPSPELSTSPKSPKTASRGKSADSSKKSKKKPASAPPLSPSRIDADEVRRQQDGTPLLSWMDALRETKVELPPESDQPVNGVSWLDFLQETKDAPKPSNGDRRLSV